MYSESVSLNVCAFIVVCVLVFFAFVTKKSDLFYVIFFIAIVMNIQISNLAVLHWIKTLAYILWTIMRCTIHRSAPFKPVTCFNVVALF